MDIMGRISFISGYIPTYFALLWAWLVMGKNIIRKLTRWTKKAKTLVEIALLVESRFDFGNWKSPKRTSKFKLSPIELFAFGNLSIAHCLRGINLGNSLILRASSARARGSHLYPTPSPCNCISFPGYCMPRYNLHKAVSFFNPTVIWLKHLQTPLLLFVWSVR